MPGLEKDIELSSYISNDPLNLSFLANYTYLGENGSYQPWPDPAPTPPAPNWWGLVAIVVVLLTLFGNMLLILAISWDRRLQNMTNYFLMSLACTDLMVASLVMPLSIVVLIMGHFPFSSELCLVWISLDVLFCTASIMHLCTLSVDRFLSLRFPMKFGRNKTRRRVVLKIVLVWCLSLAASLPLSLMYATSPHATIVDGVCQIPVSLFQIIASVICFYIPLVIMLMTYALTVRLLSKKLGEGMMVGGVEVTPSPSPSPRSLRWKKLLCKTTSSLTTTTAVSLTEQDLGPTPPPSCTMPPASPLVDNKMRRLSSSPQRRPPLVRYTSHHYHRTAMLRGVEGEPLRAEGDNRPPYPLIPPSSGPSPSYELSVFPPAGARSAPSSTTTSPLHRPRPVSQEGSIAPPPFEQNGDPGGCEAMGQCEGGDAGGVAVPCSCAPRFFIEDMKADMRVGGHGDELHPQDSPSPFRSRHNRNSKDQRRHSGSRRRRCFSCCRFPCRLRRNKNKEDVSLSSPWHEGSSPPRTPQDLVTRAAIRSGGQVTTMVHKPCSTDSSSSSSSRGLWRQQSCSASLKFVSSKRHGRNIRMEQKATKVLGVVFFTFVLLWAPFFIINVLISCGLDLHIGEAMINLVTWLGYVSSMVNPFFYTFFNKTFRQTFLKILKCDMERNRKYHF